MQLVMIKKKITELKWSYPKFGHLKISLKITKQRKVINSQENLIKKGIVHSS